MQMWSLSPMSRWHELKGKVKCTLVQALRLCTGRTGHRGSRGIGLLFHDQRHQKRVRGQRHAPAALYPRERPGTHCTGGWVGTRTGLKRCRKSRSHRDSIPDRPTLSQSLASSCRSLWLRRCNCDRSLKWAGGLNRKVK